jgi:hypothetical protein
MALLTAAEAQALGVGAGLVPADLQRILDDEEAELVRRCGAHTGLITEVLRTRRGDDSVFLSRPIGAVVSLSDQLYVGDPLPTPRDAADYQVWASEGRIERAAMSLPWGAVVTVSYSPADTQALRRSVLLELARVAIEQAASVGAGGGSVSGLGYSVSSGGGTATDWGRARQTQYGRLGWRS